MKIIENKEDNKLAANKNDLIIIDDEQTESIFPLYIINL